jgi:hypothetical protein
LLAFNLWKSFKVYNSISVIMSGPGAGFEYPSTEVSWLKRDVLLFAVSIGCTVEELHFIYVR